MSVDCYNFTYKEENTALIFYFIYLSLLSVPTYLFFLPFFYKAIYTTFIFSIKLVDGYNFYYKGRDVVCVSFIIFISLLVATFLLSSAA